MKHLINYLCIRVILSLLACSPSRFYIFWEDSLGMLPYFLMPRFRKRALSNIALSGIAHTQEEICQIGRLCFQNLMITCLEYPKFAREEKIEKIATCRNPDEANGTMSQGKG